MFSSTESNLIQSQMTNASPVAQSQVQREEGVNKQMDSENSNQQQTPAQSKNEIRIKTNDYSFLKKADDFTKAVNSQMKQINQNVLNSLVENKNISMYISILVDNDLQGSAKLKDTLDSIQENVQNLPQGISQENVVICCFINNINEDYFFKDIPVNVNADTFISKWNYQKNDVFSNNNLNILVITGIKYITIKDPEAMSFFYNSIISSGNITANAYILNIKSGFTMTKNDFLNMMHLCANKQNCILVPGIETKSETPVGIWTKIRQYEYVHYQIYDLNYFDMSGCVPIDHRFNLMKLNMGEIQKIQLFYNITPQNAYIEHCDYALALHCIQNQIAVCFCDNQKATVDDSNISFSDYMESFTKKHGGDFSCTIELMKYLINCQACNIGHKFVLVLEIIGMLFEFIQPSLTCMVAYTVFSEGFNTTNTKPAIFLTAFFGILYILSGISSLISKKPQTNATMNFVFFIVFEVYYVFILAVSICAMHFVNKKKPDKLEPYNFNTAAMVTIIVLNFVFGLVPLGFQVKRVFRNIVNMLLYLVMGASSSSTHFLMNYMHKLGDFRGSKTEMERNKMIYIIVFYLANCLFGFLTLCNRNRKERVVTVIVLASIFTGYNILKMVVILLKQILFSGKNASRSGIETKGKSNNVTDKGNVDSGRQLAQEKPNDFENDANMMRNTGEEFNPKQASNGMPYRANIDNQDYDDDYNERNRNYNENQNETANQAEGNYENDFNENYDNYYNNDDNNEQ